MCRLDDGPVAADVRHRGEHVEGLGPGDARHRVHCQRGDSARGELLDDGRIERGGKQTDQVLTGM